jgi:hypothetical protein
LPFGLSSAARTSLIYSGPSESSTSNLQNVVEVVDRVNTFGEAGGDEVGVGLGADLFDEPIGAASVPSVVKTQPLSGWHQ